MDDTTDLHIDLRQMILAIETAISLVGMNDTDHGKRVGYIASQLGHELGFSELDIQYAFDLGLLHDCGVSTEQMHSNLVNHFDWTDAQLHCDIGYKLLSSFAPLAKFATPIRYHHTPWQQLQQLEISPHDARMANLIFLADRIDVMAASHYGKDILLARQDIRQSISQHAPHYFASELVAAFNTIEQHEAFWIALENRHVTRYTWDMGNIPSLQQLTLPQIKQLSLILSYIVDQKSPFTAQHSLLVADLAKFIAKCYGLFNEQCDKVEIAALLHDLGKLHTPDYILEKPGPLSNVERAIMNQHSYETYEILRHIKGLEDIARWAAFHHEGVNGVGYPFHPNQRDFSTESRIIAVADVFQALVQDRPYRQGMALPQVLDILDQEVAKGKLDGEIVQLLHRLANDCFSIAKGLVSSDNTLRMHQLTA
ncbi:HD domain-containing phosphohydrolase [Shewanella sp.]|uniref:HD-GYP domain-containing protein n=1 Tax=Shewanella sp. TaxID=50422 RepID=UPI003A96E657